MHLHGILEIEDPDYQGETFVVAGADLSNLNSGRALLHHESYVQDLECILGAVESARAIYSSRDCQSATDLTLLDVAKGKPFVKVVARLFDYLPRAQWSVACNVVKGRPKYFFGAFGTILERHGNRIEKSIIESVGVVIRPVHPALRVFKGSGSPAPSGPA